MMIYVSCSQVGIFRIYPSRGRFQLEMAGNIYGSYHSAVAAADDVFRHVTGFDAWDRLDGKIEGPRDLSEWTLE